MIVEVSSILGGGLQLSSQSTILTLTYNLSGFVLVSTQEKMTCSHAGSNKSPAVGYQPCKTDDKRTTTT
eukprot:11155596-Ditylum_brightwellii.AAC.1